MPEVVAFRHANWDTPFWANPNRSEARFNRADSWPTQYLSLHPLTTWAEYLRRENFRTRDQLLEVSGRLWVTRLRVPDDALDLGFDNARTVGVEPEDLVGPDYAPCQAFADRWRADETNPQVILVPSAALPGTKNVVIFGPRVRIPYAWSAVDPDVDVAASVVAERARPPLTLPQVVCYRGGVHAGLEAWRAGQPFTAVEPPVPSSDG